MKKLLTLCLSASCLSLAACGDNLTVPTHPGYDAGGGGGDAGALSCVPNLDGKVDAAEFKAVLNTPVSYLVGQNRQVDLVGLKDGSGVLTWTFSQDFADDASVTISASDLNGKWYQASFPEGQWVAPSDLAGTIDGVYAADDQAIYLLGLASTEENPMSGKTLLVYDTKVAVYRFPLEPGASWTSVGHITNAVVGNLPYTGTHTYEIADDAIGQLALHALTFTQVHRVRTTLTITAPAGPDTTVKRQTGFVYECFGEVTRATAAINEPNENFTTAAELRRLGN
jgi:hypothetical protein